MPILRPLVGDDKIEIIDIARRIGTYDISIQPDQDCCSLFVPKHPETKANRIEIEKSESRLDVESTIESLARLGGGSVRIPVPMQRGTVHQL